MTLRIDIPGVPVSGNHRHGLTPQGQIYLTQRARDYSRRIQSIAKAEVTRIGWLPPDYVRVDIEMVNIGMDRDNVSKTVNDAMQGIVYANDSRILDGWIRRRKDPTRAAVVTIIVDPVDGKVYGFSKPRVRPTQGLPRTKRSLPAYVSNAIAIAMAAKKGT